jgi:murein DD-endopeptidase MepM/ murein hydrolase activator NlpD
LLRMRMKAGIVAFAAAMSVLLITEPAWAPASGCGGGSGGVGGSGGSCGSGGYVNPLHHQRWYAGRIDMGVDYSPIHRQKVVAIGDARILGSDKNSGWPGGHFIWYRLLNGDHSGDVIYVAEYLKKMVHKGKRVNAGERIATAVPGGTGTEWGWATADGQARAAPCYHEGMKTNSGKEMARFLRSLGAEIGDHVRHGPDDPSGRRC